jgi:hypothetical protein
MNKRIVMHVASLIASYRHEQLFDYYMQMAYFSMFNTFGFRSLNPTQGS